MSWSEDQKQAERQRLIEEWRDRVIDLYKRYGQIDAVFAQVPLTRKVVAEIVATIPNRESYRRKGHRVLYTRDELIAHLRRARDHVGEPLSGLTYQQIAPELGLAAYNTQASTFGSFPEALRAAGVKGNRPRGRRAGSITADSCVEAVVRCVRAYGRRVSYEEYCQWAAKHGAVSGPSVRLHVGWGTAIDRALAEVT